MDLWGFESREGLPGEGFGLLQWTAPYPRPTPSLGADPLRSPITPDLQQPLITTETPVPNTTLRGSTPLAPEPTPVQEPAPQAPAQTPAEQPREEQPSGNSNAALMMGMGMVAKAGTDAIVGVAQANAMQVSAQAQANAFIFSALKQANAAIVNSNNELDAVRASADVAKMGIANASMIDRMRIATNLADRLDQNFTAIQIATTHARVADRQNSNLHNETMEQLRVQEREIKNRRNTVDTSPFRVA